MKILTAAEIRRIDRLSHDKYGIPGTILMENAGMRVVEAVDGCVDDLDGASVLVLCGKGNNGGDGFVVARQLIQRGAAPQVFLFARPDAVSGDARQNLDILTALGHGPVVVDDRAAWDEAASRIGEVDVVVDALLGTGLSKPVDGLLARAISSINDVFSKAAVVSVDVPSGSAADSGDVQGPVVEADVTVTFSALKHCLVSPPACHFAGEVIVADIGNPHPLIDSAKDAVELLDPASFPDAAFPRDLDTHKGDYGKVLIVGGSLGKGGAAAMAARAALQSGAGLVTAAVPRGTLPVVAGHTPEVMTEALPETADGTLSAEALRRVGSRLVDGKSVVAIGPGIGTHPETFDAVRELVKALELPVVLDADGINAFAGHAEALIPDGSGAAPRILTPHPGEMARLTGASIAEIHRDRLTVAREFASAHGVHIVLKGFRTVIAGPDGSAFVNPTGNAGMATAGSGDVLTGMIAGVLGQPHLGALAERIGLAVFLHGLAGDRAANEVGEESMLATDILHFLPEAWSELRDA